MDQISVASQASGDKLKELVETILNIVSTALLITENPILSVVSLLLTGLGGFLIYWWIKRWIKKKSIEAAEKDTQKDFQDQIENRLPENKEANEKDDQNRKDLDKLQ
jgi:Zn-dependent protease with chaperone function